MLHLKNNKFKKISGGIVTHSSKKGSLEVICGSMFSGKTEELIRRLKRAQYAHKTVIAFKHSLDKRRELEYVTSHNGEKLAAVATDSVQVMRRFITQATHVVGIDETQFYSEEIIDFVQELIESGKDVIITGLDLDFRGLPFAHMPILLALADSVTKLKAICIRCGADAHFSQRLVNQQPAKFDDPLILIGAQECYEARCRSCFEIDKPARFCTQAPCKQKSVSV